MGFAYLGQPYSDPSPEVMHERYKLGTIAAASLLKQGIAVYSPIVHCHQLALIADLPTDADFWSHYNQSMLEKADALYTLCLWGWKNSVGLMGERAFARIHKIPEMFVLLTESQVHVRIHPPL